MIQRNKPKEKLKRADMNFHEESESLKDRLIIAGIEEIAEHGVANFSLRRVAASCNTSCAAPYKHFKNKDELILGIISYINSQWVLLKNHILEIFKADDKKALIEVCIAYIRFWMTNPNYRTVLSKSGGELLSVNAEISEQLKLFCKNRQMSDDECTRLIYTVTALVYGTTSMLEHNELENNDATFALVRETLSSALDV
jgi:AcrR family transcriptional regulator